MTLSQSDLSELLDAIRAGDGEDVLRNAMRLALQELIELEAAQVIGAARYFPRRCQSRSLGGPDRRRSACHEIEACSSPTRCSSSTRRRPAASRWPNTSSGTFPGSKALFLPAHHQHPRPRERARNLIRHVRYVAGDRHATLSDAVRQLESLGRTLDGFRTSTSP